MAFAISLYFSVTHQTEGDRISGKNGEKMSAGNALGIPLS